MADEAVRVSQQQTKPIKIQKWKIREGNTAAIGRVILIYEFADAQKPEQRKLKVQQAGIIHRILAEEGQVVQPGYPLYEIKACRHPTIMNDMCAECGEDLRKEDAAKSTASVPMIHAIPDLKVSHEQAQKLGQADSDRLIRDRKLVLLVDLDQTLIHTTNDNIPPNIKDVYHFQLYGPTSPWYHTRLRPGTQKFLRAVCEFYELHICTFGTRNYAHTIAMFLDPDQKYFGHRILSRDECFDPTSKKANLSALFPCGDDMVCIIDDREDVWSHAQNLIHVKPYHFFQHTGDINAPPGLDKHEADEKEGVDLTKIVDKSSMKSESETNSEKKENEKNNGENCDKKVDSSENSNEVQETNGEIVKEDEIENVTIEEAKSPKESTKSNEASSSAHHDTISEVDIFKSDSTNSQEHAAELKVDEESSKSDLDNKIEANGVLKAVQPSAQNEPEDNMIEIEDPDDYLVYLEAILQDIHKSYYELYEKLEAGKIPDLKKVIPYVKGRVLNGCKLVFSGLVPTHCKLEDSKAYQVARSLGAEVQVDLDDDTTHLVAVRPGTAKVNAGRRKKNLKIVTPDWLWCCAERWEHVDERIFHLNAKGSKNRHPPPHCSSPEHIPSYPEHDTPGIRKRTPSGRFMDTINPLMSFSSDDIADMDKEVEDILDDEDDDDESEDDEEEAVATQADNEEDTDVEDVNLKHMVQTEILDAYNQVDDGEREETAANDDNLKEDKVFNKKRQREVEEESREELPSQKFRKGEDVDELDMDPLQDPDEYDSDSFEAPDESDDGEWNMMGAALEREFLSD